MHIRRGKKYKLGPLITQNHSANKLIKCAFGFVLFGSSFSLFAYVPIFKVQLNQVQRQYYYICNYFFNKVRLQTWLLLNILLLDMNFDKFIIGLYLLLILLCLHNF